MPFFPWWILRHVTCLSKTIGFVVFFSEHGIVQILEIQVRTSWTTFSRYFFFVEQRIYRMTLFPFWQSSPFVFHSKPARLPRISSAAGPSPRPCIFIFVFSLYIRKYVYITCTPDT